MTSILKPFVALLPVHWQQALKRYVNAARIRRGTFTSDEPEFTLLSEWVKPGDKVIDVGANEGVFTLRLSELVGPSGHVWALEPMPQTFALLTANVARCRFPNWTALQVAASDTASHVSMKAPIDVSTGLVTHTQAAIVPEGSGGVSVRTLPIDGLNLPSRIALVKVDVEGHELPALQGMRQLLMRDHPMLIIEGRDPDVEAFLKDLGYWFVDTPKSPNRVYFYTKP